LNSVSRDDRRLQCLPGALQAIAEIAEATGGSRGMKASEIEDCSDDGPSAFDGAWTGPLSAVSSDWREASKRGDGSPVDVSKLEQFRDQSRRDDWAHAGRRLQDFIDGRQFGIGINEPDHLLLDLCDAAFKDGNQGLDIGTNIGVRGLLEPGVPCLRRSTSCRRRTVWA
jgi:hypothetical protein